jgi:hypothetical protein
MSSVFAGSAVWFGAIEFTESSHHLNFAIALAALAFTSWIVVAILRAFARTIVAIVQAVWYARSAAPRAARTLHAIAPPVASNPAYRFRVFSRPPPLFS